MKPYEDLKTNLFELMKCIVELEQYSTEDAVPFELVAKIDGLGIYIKNCAFHLGYDKKYKEWSEQLARNPKGVICTSKWKANNP